LGSEVGPLPIQFEAAPIVAAELKQIRQVLEWLR
jgi:hypothetical protein